MKGFYEQLLVAEIGKEYKKYKIGIILSGFGATISLLAGKIFLVAIYIFLAGFLYSLMKFSVIEFEYEVQGDYILVTEIFNKNKRKIVAKILKNDIEKIVLDTDLELIKNKEYNIKKLYPKGYKGNCQIISNCSNKSCYELALNDELKEVIRIKFLNKRFTI